MIDLLDREATADNTHARRSAESFPVEDVELDLESVAEQLSWLSIFGNEQAVEVDIGCGKGRYVIEAAKAAPDVNFLGVELAGKPFHLARERIAKRALRNVRVARTDARSFVAERVPERSVATYHILFPDPWPKKRHHKRRVVTPGFVCDLARTLRDGGVLELASDIVDYFDELAFIVESTRRFRLVEESSYDSTSDLLTNFAAKYIDQGRNLYRARFALAD